MDGKKIRIIRIKNNIKLVELAKESKLNISTLSLWENGWIVLNPNQIQKLKNGFSNLGLNKFDL